MALDRMADLPPTPLTPSRARPRRPAADERSWPEGEGGLSAAPPWGAAGSVGVPPRARGTAAPGAATAERGAWAPAGAATAERGASAPGGAATAERGGRGARAAYDGAEAAEADGRGATAPATAAAATRPPTPPADAGPSPDAVVALTPPRPRVKRLRLALILAGLGLLAVISLVFGMMMAVASEIPSLENHAEFRAAQNSVLLAGRGGPPIAKLTGNQNRILLGEGEISPNVENAVIAIEDQRFYQHKGVDYHGILRALWQDVVRRGATQGASTITEQFVKNALAAQGHRTVFEKLREAALAYHLERRWTKQKIITQYLNTVYFGNGAYGVESAMRTYFGTPGKTYGLNERVARNASPAEGALLASIIASPSAYDPAEHPKASRNRRNLVLADMLRQRLITRGQYDEARREALPSDRDISPPKPDSRAPYFSTWVTQQLVDRYGPGRVFGGGLRITTTLDMELQRQAEQAIHAHLGPGGPSASLVAIDNRTGAVKALVGGDDFERRPFNIATNGHRQPGSALKPFTLIEALRRGYGPGSTFTSRPKVFRVPGSGGQERFVVHNYQNEYLGSASLADATAHSDNSVYAELGLRLGTKRIAALAERMGIRTHLSTNPAMTLGGLKEGVTPLELAYAYSTIADRGERRWGSLAPDREVPATIQQVTGDHVDDRNRTGGERVFSKRVGEEARSILQGVVLNGTGRLAQIPGHFVAGKTGTTENYGDAWFCGFDERYTVCVWVGYPDKLRYMRTEFRGGPVAGGTFPAAIWRDFMVAAIALEQARHPGSTATGASGSTATGASGSTPGTGTGATPTPTPQHTYRAQPATPGRSSTPTYRAPTTTRSYRTYTPSRQPTQRRSPSYGTGTGTGGSSGSGRSPGTGGRSGGGSSGGTSTGR